MSLHVARRAEGARAGTWSPCGGWSD